MNRHWISIVLLTVSAGCRVAPVAADDAAATSGRDSPAHSPEPAAAPSADEAVAALEKEFGDAQQAVFARLEELATDEEKTKYYLEHRPKPAEYAQRFLAIADANPRTDAAARALAWIVQTNDGENPAVRPALERLARDHAASARLLGVCSSLQYQSGDHVDGILEKLEKDSPNASVRGAALYALAKRALKAEDSGSKRSPAEAETLLERVVTEYGDVLVPPDYKLGDLARGALFELRELAIGKVAPNIEGEDIDGTRFALADYKGKVVVLDFWGNW